MSSPERQQSIMRNINFRDGQDANATRADKKAKVHKRHEANTAWPASAWYRGILNPHHNMRKARCEDAALFSWSLYPDID